MKIAGVKLKTYGAIGAIVGLILWAKNNLAQLAPLRQLMGRRVIGNA